MGIRIGILLPRSTDYPAMGFDLLDGLRGSLKQEGITQATVIPENIGFGEDRQANYAKAEKLFMQDDIDLLVAYLSVSNAEALYPLIKTVGKPLLVLDPGMSHPTLAPESNVFFISLQGLHASYLAGKKAAEGGAEVIMATSFYDGGYRGPWAYTMGIAAAGGRIVHNYVGHYKESEFTVKPMLDVMIEKKTERIAACFSTYLSTLFVNGLQEQNGGLPPANYYCSPFMAEEQLLESYKLPGGNFYAFIPWSSDVNNESNDLFKETIQKEKKKPANLFHLFGWEAGIVAAHLIRQAENSGTSITDAASSLGSFQYKSPRGTVNIHPETRTTYAPLHYAEIREGDENKCRLMIIEQVEIGPEEHKEIMNKQPEGMTSGWFNNYFCT
jgi:branched-chain amino acid transport system substrate-binding protein